MIFSKVIVREDYFKIVIKKTINDQMKIQREM